MILKMPDAVGRPPGLSHRVVIGNETCERYVSILHAQCCGIHLRSSWATTEAPHIATETLRAPHDRQRPTNGAGSTRIGAVLNKEEPRETETQIGRRA